MFKLIDIFCLEKGDVCSASHAVGLGTRPKCCWQFFPCNTCLHQQLEYNHTTHCYSGTEQLKTVPLQSFVHAPGQLRTSSCKHPTHQTRPPLKLARLRRIGPLTFSSISSFSCLLCIQVLLISNSAGAYA